MMDQKRLGEDRITLGWQEWVSLPSLGLPAIKAKIDTGAKTSALHAVAIEPFGRIESPQVRFIIQPNPADPTVEIVCAAKVIDRRHITSSNSESELRYVIEAPIVVGGREWRIEITLTNRETMTYRMLLGRKAVVSETLVDPGASFVQPVLDYEVYKNAPRRRPVKRPLRIALLTKEPKNYSSKRLIEAAESRGHVIEPLDTSRCYMAINARLPEVHYDGLALERFDAVIPRIGASITAYGMAVVRQFDMMGVYCLNRAGAIGAARDKLYAHQVLARHGVDMPQTAFASSPKDTKDLVSLAGEPPLVVKLLQSSQGRGVVLADKRNAAESLIDAFRNLDADFLVQAFVKEAAGEDVRCFVIGGKVFAAMQRTAAEGDFRSNLHQGGSARAVKLTKDERKMAVRAAKAIGLSVAGVDILRTERGPVVLEVNASPGLKGVEEVSKRDVAGAIIEYVEGHVRSVNRLSAPDISAKADGHSVEKAQ